jgi:4-hydroxy-3-polyprenylbenzoate decarboxylase
MAAATEAGAIVAPPVPAFYGAPRSIDDIVDHSVGRCLDLFGIDTRLVQRWGEPAGDEGQTGGATSDGRTARATRRKRPAV